MGPIARKRPALFFSVLISRNWLRVSAAIVLAMTNSAGWFPIAPGPASASPYRSLWQTSGINVALASNGATASASSTFSASYPASATIDGVRKGLNWGAGGGWNDGTNGTWPDWLEVDFPSTKTVSEVDVFTLQDNFSSPSDPTLTMTFSSYGITGFSVQYWDGSSWLSVAGGDVTGNNKVWK